MDFRIYMDYGVNDSNTTFVKVKLLLYFWMAIKEIYSNTTFVKVKFEKVMEYNQVFKKFKYNIC